MAWKDQKARGNRTKREILVYLGKTPRTAEYIADRVRISDTLSRRYLRLLESRGLVLRHKVGRGVLWTRVYATPRITTPGPNEHTPYI